MHGLRGWHRDVVTVLVDDELSFEALDGVRLLPLAPTPDNDAAATRHLPVRRIEPAVLLFAGYEADLRTGCGAIIASVQQRLSTTDRFDDWLESMRPLRRAREFRRLLCDVDGGAHSVAERDLRQACRAFGVALPRGQQARLDRIGRRRWTDAEWDLPDGRVLVLEVDVVFHDDVLQPPTIASDTAGSQPRTASSSPARRTSCVTTRDP